MRSEVLHAEMLLRSLLAEHHDCAPARLAVADYMVERGDLDDALQWLRTPQADDSDGKLGFAVARLQFARGDPAAARAALEAVLLRQQRFLEAWSMLGEVCDATRRSARLRAQRRRGRAPLARGRTDPLRRHGSTRGLEPFGPAALDPVDGLLEPAPHRGREGAVRHVVEAIDAIEH